MNQISCFNFSGFVIIVIILISNCVVCHEKSANRRMSRLTDDGSVQLQQHHLYHYQKQSIEPNTDQRNVNIVKDRFTNSDKIIFDRGDLYGMINNERTTTVPSMTISNNIPKTNETNHQYSGKANGEYEFR